MEVRVLFWAPFPSLQTTTKVQKHPKKSPRKRAFLFLEHDPGRLTLCAQACRTLSYSGDMLQSISSKSVKRFGRHAPVISTYIWQSMQFSPSERTAFFELLKWRRDVRHFSDRPVDDGIIEALQEAMDYAPSVGNARPWRVISVETAGKRAAVHDIFLEANRSAAQIYDGE
ncbi:MAG: nitroreductase family protein, partial [Brucella intermedia]